MLRKNHILMLLVALVVMCLSQASCGFRLRGKVNIPAEFLPIAIAADGVYIQLTPVLTQALQGAGLSLVETNDANSVLRLIRENYVKKLLTVATSGESQTHSLQYMILFEVVKRNAKMTADNEQDVDGKQSAADQTSEVPLGQGNDSMRQVVTVSRSFQFEKKAVLSSATEEAIIKKEMLTDAAQQILRRLNYLHTDPVTRRQLPSASTLASDTQYLLP
jgi:outer membrane lipopolysaccharide assembly protein LptE/RlpB